jgi:O-antigen biosynthesis protein
MLTAADESDNALLPFVSVVICTHQRAFQLRRCLEATYQLEYPSFEIVVVDNSPEDDSTSSTVRDFSRVRYAVERRLGLSRARNHGLSISNGEIIAFLDDDALPHPDWLRQIVGEFRDAQVMAVAGRVIPVAGQQGSGEAGRLRGSYRGGESRRIVGRANEDWYVQANFGALGIGANMAFRRAVLKAWNGFDVRLGRGTPLYVGEDTFAFSEIIRAGFSVVYAPTAIVEHPFAPPEEDLVQRRLRTRSAFTAYLSFLLLEEPAQAFQVLRHLFQRVLGARIEWRETVAMPEQEIVPRWRIALALLQGPFIYFGQLFRRRS